MLWYDTCLLLDAKAPAASKHPGADQDSTDAAAASCHTLSQDCAVGPEVVVCRRQIAAVQASCALRMAWECSMHEQRKLSEAIPFNAAAVMLCFQTSSPAYKLLSLFAKQFCLCSSLSANVRQCASSFCLQHQGCKDVGSLTLLKICMRWRHVGTMCGSRSAPGHVAGEDATPGCLHPPGWAH